MVVVGVVWCGVVLCICCGVVGWVWLVVGVSGGGWW